MTDLDIVSLFSGVGGIDLAFERAGATPRLLCEQDKHAAKVLAAHWPDIPLYPDVKELTPDDLRAAGARPGRAVVCAGFPCQDLSVAGRRAGLREGTRSGLFFEIVRLLRDFPARWVVLENVPGLLSQDGGRAMGTVLGSLADLGYGFAYRVLDAQYFGVPQRRRRVVIVGCLGDSGAAPAQVLLEPEDSGGDSPAGDAPGPGAAEPSARGVDGAGVVTPTLTATYGEQSGQDCLAHAVRGALPPAPCVVGTLTASQGGVDDNYARTGRLVVEPATFQKVTRPATSDHPDVRESRDVAATLSPFDLGSESRACELVVEGVRTSVRRITPLECERLQGIPDNWTAGQSDRQRYKQMGNGVAVPVFEWVARRLVSVDGTLP